MKKKHLGLIGAALILLSLCLPTFAKAADNSGVANGFRISPVRFETIIDKGATASATVTVTNITNGTVEAQALVNDFEASQSENGQPRIILDSDKSAPFNSFKTLVSPIPNVTLKPNEATDVEVTMSVPANASAGGYYGAIRFAPASTISGGTVSLSASVGALFLITVPGDLKEALQLVDFSAASNSSTSRIFTSGKNLSIITKLRNTGNIHVKPFGKVQVINMHGKVIEEFEFNEAEPKSNVLPNSIRQFEDKLKNQKWFGRYTIVANIGYGTTGGLITAKNNFWVIPIWFIVICAVLILAVIIGSYIVYHKYITTKRHHNRIRRR